MAREGGQPLGLGQQGQDRRPHSQPWIQGREGEERLLPHLHWGCDRLALTLAMAVLKDTGLRVL